MTPTYYIKGSFQSAAKLALALVAMSSFAIAQAPGATTYHTGDAVKLNRPALLYFQNQIYTAGKEGDSFVVLEYRPTEKKVYVAGKDKDGKVIALAVGEEAVGPVTTEKPASTTAPAVNPAPAQQTVSADFPSLEALLATGDMSKPFKPYDVVDYSAIAAFTQSIRSQYGKTVTFTVTARGKATRSKETEFHLYGTNDLTVGNCKFRPEYITLKVVPESIESTIGIRPGTTVRLTGTLGSISSIARTANDVNELNLYLQDVTVSLNDTTPAPTAIAGAPAALTPTPVPAKSSSKLALAQGWETSMRGGSETIADLEKLFGTLAKPNANLDGDDSIKIYQDVAYLTPIRTAMAALKLGRPASKVLISCPGFPKDSFYYYAVDGTFEGEYNRMYLVADRADQVVSVELVNESIPKGHPLVPSQHEQGWRTYDFVNNRVKGSPAISIGQWIALDPTDPNLHPYPAIPSITDRNRDWRVARVDSLMYQETKKPYVINSLMDLKEKTRWYVPRPLVELILHCVQSK